MRDGSGRSILAAAGHVGTGTGMGLAVVYGIVEAHDGTIEVESVPEKGSKFTILFPEAFGTDKSDEEKEEKSSRGEGRVLFVDDEPELLSVTKALLERLGYDVTAVKSSNEALRLFEEAPNSYDLVITEETMPGITGTSLAQKMIKIRPDVPIILCTGYSDTVSSEVAKKAGIRDFLMKPLLKTEISVTLQQVLKKPQAN